MFVFLHGYSPDTWDAMVNAGLVRKDDGIRFCQSIEIKDELKFNNLARKDGPLYNIIKERKCPFYVDRLQGGCYFEGYDYDTGLLNDYRDLLGDKFWGFQMHEWLSNYGMDVFTKLKELSEDEWTAENIRALISKKYPGKILFIESMSPEEMAAAGKPKTVEQFTANMFAIYKKRMTLGDLIPCDSYMLAYPFEMAAGTKRIMPEVGAQTPNARVQICFARAMTRNQGKSFGIYYEPWGGEPFSACMYNSIKNEWGIDENSDFPFKTAGPTGGSSRSLQKRIFLYGYLNNADFMSEEWGLYNTFTDCETFPLSEYGKVKKAFIDFVEKYPDVGEKLAPAALVLPEDLPVLDADLTGKTYCGMPNTSEKITNAKRLVSEILCSSAPMLGTETRTLLNSPIPDAVDLLTEQAGLLTKYTTLVDATGDPAFTGRHQNVCTPDELVSVLREKLPCFVEGNLHWLVNERAGGGYYLTVFNHSGVVRTVEKGEYTLPEAEETGIVTFKTAADPEVLEGLGTITPEGDHYRIIVPAGEFAFIRF